MTTIHGYNFCLQIRHVIRFLKWYNMLDLAKWFLSYLSFCPEGYREVLRIAKPLMGVSLIIKNATLLLKFETLRIVTLSIEGDLISCYFVLIFCERFQRYQSGLLTPRLTKKSGVLHKLFYNFCCNEPYNTVSLALFSYIP